MILNLQHLADKEENPEDTSSCVELTTNVQLDITYLTCFDTDVQLMEALANTRDDSSLDHGIII
jgi:hypothetical protein